MSEQKLAKNVQHVCSLEEDQLFDWFKQNKKAAKEIIESLKHIPLKQNRYGRIQFRQAVWHYKNNIMNPVKCANPSCDNYVKWNDTLHRYQKFCSNKCNHAAGNLLEKRKRTNKKKYGVDNVFRDVEQMKKARKIKLGAEHATQSKSVKEKTKKYFIERYGVDHPWKKPSIRKKSTETRKYQYVNNAQLKHLTDRKWMYNHLVEQDLTQQQIAEKLGVAQSTVGLYIDKLNIEYTCKSKIENQLYKFIQQNCSHEIIRNDRKLCGCELDIVIPKLNLAIEVDGVYWHGENKGKGKKYHLNKTEKAKGVGLQLLHILDVEWHTKQEIVKSRLLSFLNKNERVYARKCSVVNLTKYQAKSFFNQNHIQGHVGYSKAYGLMYNDEIVAAMSFGVPRYTKKYEYELLRFCNRKYTNVVGGASKLLKTFLREQKPPSIISYGDRRWGNGKLYEKLGFGFVSNTPPNYYYFNKSTIGKDHDVLSRIHFQKHKLKDKLNYFDPNLTEWENMQLNGYDRIWDCGNSKWALYP